MKFSYCKFCNSSKKELNLNSTVAKFTTVQIEKEIVENSTTEFF